MKILETIRDSDLGFDSPAPASYEERMAARALVFDREGTSPPLNATKKNEHKLPGRGVEQGESIEDALRRELVEEIGCAIENIRGLGAIEEFRNEFALHQISHCFFAHLSGEKGIPNLQAGEEIEDGFETVWLNLDKAIATLEYEADIQRYEGKFIRLRDLTFLQEAANASITHKVKPCDKPCDITPANRV